MNDFENTVKAVDTATNVILLSMVMLQQLTGKTRDEVLEIIREKGAETDRLLKHLK
jgi:hypothetical protein